MIELTRKSFCLVLASIAMLSIAHAAAPPIPKTPAGQVLAEWLEAFNRGDAASMQTFVTNHQSRRSLDEELMLRKFSGGFDLLTIEQSTPTRIVFKVREKNSSSEAIGKLVVDEANPASVRIFAMYESPPGAKYADFRLNATERNHIVTSIQRTVEDNYVFPDVGHTISSSLRQHLDRGDYDAIMEGEGLAERLTADVQAVNHDKHLTVDFYLLPQSAPSPSKTTDDEKRHRQEMARANCGFEKAEHLPGNIGYLKIDQFAEPVECGDVAVSAIGFIANSDAVIFDLRENNGGVARMIQLLSTYLFEKTTHLNDFYQRKENETTQIRTLPYVPGKRLTQLPVYILTSRNTFSAGEEFAYNLKVLKRATLVGETTAGGAHPVAPHRISEHFTVLVPFARAINPITKTNWEGVGVDPDVKVAATDALATAIKLAKKQLNETSTAQPQGQ